MFSLLLLSLFKSNMSVERRLAHKFSLTCHNRFIAGCCRSGGQWTGTCTLQKVHTLLGLNRLPGPEFLIPWALLWSQIFGPSAAAPCWQRSGKRAGLGLARPDNYPNPLHATERRRGGWGGRRDAEREKWWLLWPETLLGLLKKKEKKTKKKMQKTAGLSYSFFFYLKICFYYYKYCVLTHAWQQPGGCRNGSILSHQAGGAGLDLDKLSVVPSSLQQGFFFIVQFKLESGKSIYCLHKRLWKPCRGLCLFDVLWKGDIPSFMTAADLIGTVYQAVITSHNCTFTLTFAEQRRA